jgi:two-component system uhpT operon response regulator UhpA
VFVTVQDRRAVIKKAIDCGARGYVLKSDAGNELVAAVRTALEGGFYLSASARRVLGMTERPTADDEEGS